MYSWQEGFKCLVNKALCAAKSAGDIFTSGEEDVAALRACLARTIGTFLFDNVEVPLLVSLMTGAESVFVMDVDGDAEPQLALLLPSFAYLLYGDLLPCLLQEVWDTHSHFFTQSTSRSCITHICPCTLFTRCVQCLV